MVRLDLQSSLLSWDTVKKSWCFATHFGSDLFPFLLYSSVLIPFLFGGVSFFFFFFYYLNVKSIDRDSSGIMEEDELAQLLKSLHIQKAKTEAKKILKAKKKQGSMEKGINFDEFVELMFRY
jgi:hypothetical protein